MREEQSSGTATTGRFNVAPVTLDPLAPPPFDSAGRRTSSGGAWPAFWVTAPGVDAGSSPHVMFFELDVPAGKHRVHVSADQRYDLFVGGWDRRELAGRGPERGDLRKWHFESYDLDLPEPTRLCARVWWHANTAPMAQVTAMPAFLLAVEAQGRIIATESDRTLAGAGDDDDPTEQLTKTWNTGEAPWRAQAKPLHVDSLQRVFGVGPFSLGVTAGNLWPDDDAWQPAVVVRDTTGSASTGSGERPINVGRSRNSSSPWRMTPARLPPQHEQRWKDVRVAHADRQGPDASADPGQRDADLMEAFEKVVAGGTLDLAAGESARLVVDLGNYVCGRYFLGLHGDGEATVRWCETLGEPLADEDEGKWWIRPEKGDRSQVDGKIAWGPEDHLKADESGRECEPPWWRAGRYVQVHATAGKVGLTVGPLSIAECHFPHDFVDDFAIDDPAGDLGDLHVKLRPLCERTLEMCSHETYMDCPHYEQLQYVGDTRLQVLITYATTPDDRLPRQAVECFDDSRGAEGMVRSRYPDRLEQQIPTFALRWVDMVHDFARWRDDPAFVKARLPGVRATLDRWLDTPVEGWMFVDWIKTEHGWKGGVPDDCDEDDGAKTPGAVVGAQLATALRAGAELEEAFGRPETGSVYRRAAEAMGRRVAEVWDAERGVIAGVEHLSEHAQILALLSPEVMSALPPDAGDRMWSALCDTDFPFESKASVYFSHYLFEACHLRRDLTPMRRRLDLWRDMLALHIDTTLESPAPSRSDCHAWAAHPLLHAHTTVLGVRPAGWGFSKVLVAPLLPGRSSMPHPRGTITVDVRGRGQVEVSAPSGVEVEVDDSGLA